MYYYHGSSINILNIIMVPNVMRLEYRHPLGTVTCLVNLLYVSLDHASMCLFFQRRQKFVHISVTCIQIDTYIYVFKKAETLLVKTREDKRLVE